MSRSLQSIFSEVAGTYERINRILTFGLDGYWRRKCVEAALVGKGVRYLDLCSGTGETSVYLKRCGGEKVGVFAADFSSEMLAIAKAKPEAEDISFVIAEAGGLPFSDNTFDAVVITFAVRNINTSRDALIGRFAEVRRILKPGGHFVAMETSRPQSPIIRRLLKLYADVIVKPLGTFLSGSPTGYAYLSHTILRFFSAEELAEILREAGYSHVEFRRFTFGAVALHISTK